MIIVNKYFSSINMNSERMNLIKCINLRKWKFRSNLTESILTMGTQMSQNNLKGIDLLQTFKNRWCLSKGNGRIWHSMIYT